MEANDFIAATVAAARLTRLGSHLSVVDRGRLDRLVGLLGAERQVTVASFRDAVFAGKSDAAVTKAIERLIDNLAEAVSAADDDLAVEVRGPKRAGAAGRSIGFTARLVEQLRPRRQIRGRSTVEVAWPGNQGQWSVSIRTVARDRTGTGQRNVG